MAELVLAGMVASTFENEERAERLAHSMAQDDLASLAEFGFTVENTWSGADHKTKVIGALSDWHTQYVEPFRENAVLVDTTTLATVKALATGKYLLQGQDHEVSVTPGLLYDLCAFVNAVVLFDSVLHLENQFIDSAKLNRELGSIDPPLRQLPVESFDGAAAKSNPIVGVGGALTSLMWDAEVEVGLWRKGETPQARQARDTVREAWERATGSIVTIDHFADKDCLDQDFFSDGPQLLHQALGNEHVAPDEKIRNELDPSYLTESTVRSVFNTGVSDTIGVGYAASSARLPFRRYWLDIQNVTCTQLVAQQLDVSLSNALTRTVDKVSLELPFFPAAVLREIKEPGELLPVIGKLRDEASEFRSRRAELEVAIDEGNDLVIEELTRAVQDESHSLAKLLAVPVISGVVAIVTAPATLAQSLWIPFLSLFAAYKSLDSVNRERICRRLKRRHLCFLTKTASQSRQLRDAYPAVKRLWPLSPTLSREEFDEVFASLGQLGEA